MEKINEVLDVLEGMARQHCYMDKDGVTDSGGISANAEALELLESFGRFKIEKDVGRMVLGRWPENKK